ncbi:hypothetical protein CVT24_001126 [Panaeolus cyanescens]|uniref:Uncharacterized protein n=1 Tax=Panaeolus cyanescens TaxID=181874 RepID=A0A409YZ31_9AGAR|nr:hypothetical protein CVT24_001126 [Panaeolus cyanescens]
MDSMAVSHQPLAVELVILIINECRGDTNTLCSLALVSRLFHAEALPLLYEQITSARPQTHVAFIHNITTQNTHLIKRITKYDSSNIENMDQDLWTSMMDLVAQMDNLKELGLRISDHDYHRLKSPFRPVTTGWNPLKLIPETPRFKLHTIRLRRKAVFRCHSGWWAALIRSQSETLEHLDLRGIRGVVPDSDIDSVLQYPRLDVVRGESDVFARLLPGKRLRIVEITQRIWRIHGPSVSQELAALEGFSCMYLGSRTLKASGLFDILSWLPNVKYLGILYEPHRVGHSC